MDIMDDRSRTVDIWRAGKHSTNYIIFSELIMVFKHRALSPYILITTLHNPSLAFSRMGQ